MKAEFSSFFFKFAMVDLFHFSHLYFYSPLLPTLNHMSSNGGDIMDAMFPVRTVGEVSISQIIPAPGTRLLNLFYGPRVDPAVASHTHLM